MVLVPADVGGCQQSVPSNLADAMTPNSEVWERCEQVLALLLCIGVLLLAWRKARRSTLVTRSVLRALRHGGPIPRHVAIIMDGNRRWARRSKLAVREGHLRGGEKLTESLQWCLDANVSIVTVYAFSLENFKRPPDEVREIMRLCEEKFGEMLEQSDMIARNRVRVRVLGDLTRVSPSLRTLMHRVMARTAGFDDGPVLNICFAYTGRFDIASGVSRVVGMCDEGRLRPEDISEHTLAMCMSSGFSAGGAPVTCYPELLIRTSGETRISDFLLWDGCFSVLAFSNVLWPELTAWDFVFLILGYQARERARTAAVMKYREEEGVSTILEHGWGLSTCKDHVRKAMEHIRSEYFSTMRNLD